MTRANDRLNGWKDIAAHVGKGVRTVQRWERQLGLPVHRLGRDGGEIVFALRSEIDEWLLAAPKTETAAETVDKQSEAAPAPVEPPTAAPVAVSIESPAAAPPKVAGTFPQECLAPLARGLAKLLPTVPGTVGAKMVPGVVVAGGLAIVALSLAFGIGRGGALQPSELPQPSGVRQEERHLVALDGQGNELWKFEFPSALSANLTEVEENRLALADIDGDGGTDVVINAVGIERDSAARGLWAIDRRGRRMFHFVPTGPVRFGSQIYSGPWLGYRAWVLDDGGRRSIWAAFIHGVDFPCLLVELDGAGKVKSRFWSNGYVTSVKLATWGGRRVVLVGGVNNETMGASLAVFDRGRVAGSAPAAREKYRCVDCEPGGPRSFLVFPQRCIGQRTGTAPLVADAWIDGSEILHVLVTLGPVPPAKHSAAIWYAVRADLTPEGADIVEHEAAAHLELERAGILDHHFDAADAERAFPMLRWTGERFAELPRAAVSR